MKVNIVSPSIAMITEASSEEMKSLIDQATYVNTSVGYMIQKTRKNEWFKRSHPEAWAASLAELEAKYKKTMVQDYSGIKCIHTGFIPHIVDIRVEIGQNLIQYPAPKPMAWHKPFEFELYPYQKESVEKLLAVKHGNVALCTGAGKTEAIMALIQRLGLKTCLVVPTRSIFNEVYEKAQERFGSSKVGALGDGKKLLGRQITVCISKSLTMLKKDSDEWRDIEQNQVLAVDECFANRTPIITDSGSMEIGRIHRDRQLGITHKVLSFNETSKTFEFKKVTNSWDKGRKDSLLVVVFGQTSIRCTDNHPFLTDKGWVKAEDLQVGDNVIGYRGKNLHTSFVNLTLNSDQEQVLLGSYLGDGNVSTHKNGIRLRVIHGQDQQDYLRWKASVFGREKSVERIEKNGYAQKPAYRFQTKLISYDLGLSSPKNKYLEEVLDRLDERGLAIWFMDDGNRQAGMSRLHTESFDYDQHLIMVDYLKKKFGLTAKIRHDSKYGYFWLSFDTKNTERMAFLIKEYVHPNLDYKMLRPESDKYIWNSEYEEIGMAVVSSKKTIYKKDYTTPRSGNKFNVYDLEVEDNHNFVVGTSGGSGVVAHNCHLFAAETLSEVCFGVLRNVPYRFFVTGTMTRGDGTVKLLEAISGKTVHQMETKEGISGGYLCPLEFYVHRTFSPCTVSYKDPQKNKRVHFLSNPNIVNFIERTAVAAAKRGESSIVFVDELFQIASFNGLFKDVSWGYVHGNTLSKADKEKYGIDKCDLKKTIEDFNTGRIKVLIASPCIQTGTNLYPTHNVFNFEGSSSEIVTRQAILGRSCRKLEISKYAKYHPPKPASKIFDFSVDGQPQLSSALKKRLKWYKDTGGPIGVV